MKFGNWNITDKTIEWTGDKFNRFVIDKQSLFDTITVEGEDASMYKWIVMATEEQWLSEDDLYDLNFAFVFAAGTSPIAAETKFSYEIFDNTLDYQFSTLDEDEEIEPG
jgi:hypothetical protein